MNMIYTDLVDQIQGIWCSFNLALIGILGIIDCVMPPMQIYIDFCALTRSATREGVMIMHPSEATERIIHYFLSKNILSVDNFL